jgi:redox-sensitive bicupin YhaK (pirin superfamily)
MLRSIKGIFPAQQVDMDGVLLDQALPIFGIDQIDPFLLIHHWNKPLKGGQREQDVGVGPHPHRGFSPVTLILKGAVHHRDSRGNDSIVTAPGAQWMHSGMGIVHSERPPKQLAEAGGAFEIIQFWVNVPAEEKMTQPEYYPLGDADIPKITLDDGKTTFRLLAGKYRDVTGPVAGKTELLIGVIEIRETGRLNLSIPKHFNAAMYQIDGKVLLNNNFTIGSKQLAWFKDNGDEVDLVCVESSRALLLAGAPIGEEVTSSGPFVMNTHTEILEAMRDYQMGKMGILVENFK